MPGVRLRRRQRVRRDPAAGVQALRPEPGGDRRLHGRAGRRRDPPLLPDRLRALRVHAAPRAACRARRNAHGRPRLDRHRRLRRAQDRGARNDPQGQVEHEQGAGDDDAPVRARTVDADRPAHLRPRGRIRERQRPGQDGAGLARGRARRPLPARRQRAGTPDRRRPADARAQLLRREGDRRGLGPDRRVSAPPESQHPVRPGVHQRRGPRPRQPADQRRLQAGLVRAPRADDDVRVPAEGGPQAADEVRDVGAPEGRPAYRADGHRRPARRGPQLPRNGVEEQAGRPGLPRPGPAPAGVRGDRGELLLRLARPGNQRVDGHQGPAGRAHRRRAAEPQGRRLEDPPAAPRGLPLPGRRLGLRARRLQGARRSARS